MVEQENHNLLVRGSNPCAAKVFATQKLKSIGAKDIGTMKMLIMRSNSLFSNALLRIII